MLGMPGHGTDDTFGTVGASTKAIEYWTAEDKMIALESVGRMVRLEEVEVA